MKAYQDLETLFHRIYVLDEAMGVLGWDKEVMMQPGSIEGRTEQLSTLAVMHHELITAPQLGELLAKAEADTGGLDDWQQANLREMRRLYTNATCLPADLVKALSDQASRTEMVWRDAKPNNDFASIKPELEKMLDLTRQQAQVMSEALGVSAYDALLSQYEPYTVSADIDAVFEDLAAFLPGFLQEVIEHQTLQGEPLPLTGNFDLARQEGLCRTALKVSLFDFDKGRLDTSAHPFSTGPLDDMRITTRYSLDNPFSCLMGVVHEAGHANYTGGLPVQWRYQPVGQARGMMLHESQSLITEMQAARSREFLTFFAPAMAKAFDGEGPAWEAENVCRHYHKINQGFIRVDANEVAYPLHVILRYRLEKAMLAGELEIADLPQAWNEMFTELLGVTPPDDRRGCLQDIHWHRGAFGYFPTYTLGAMSAAQLFDSACKQDSDVLPGIARGDFRPFLNWNRQNVHAHASSLTSQEILEKATGQRLNAEVFKTHLRKRYLG